MNIVQCTQRLYSKKTWCMGPFAEVDYNLANHLMSKPESTPIHLPWATLCQSKDMALCTAYTYICSVIILTVYIQLRMCFIYLFCMHVRPRGLFYYALCLSCHQSSIVNFTFQITSIFFISRLKHENVVQIFFHCHYHGRVNYLVRTAMWCSILRNLPPPPSRRCLRQQGSKAGALTGGLQCPVSQLACCTPQPAGYPEHTSGKLLTQSFQKIHFPFKIFQP